jgi:hypothetical protein
MEYPSAQTTRAARSRPVDAFETVGWSDRREAPRTAFTPVPPEDQTLARLLSSLPDWAVIVAGGVVAAILGALVGGALHI